MNSLLLHDDFDREQDLQLQQARQQAAEAKGWAKLLGGALLLSSGVRRPNFIGGLLAAAGTWLTRIVPIQRSPKIALTKPRGNRSPPAMPRRLIR